MVDCVNPPLVPFTPNLADNGKCHTGKDAPSLVSPDFAYKAQASGNASFLVHGRVALNQLDALVNLSNTLNCIPPSFFFNGWNIKLHFLKTLDIHVGAKGSSLTTTYLNTFLFYVVLRCDSAGDKLPWRCDSKYRPWPLLCNREHLNAYCFRYVRRKIEMPFCWYGCRLSSINVLLL